ncbi:MAG: glycosyl hydrolase, partial [Maribacter sp.]|nr:glycosyl hydrolase [Maribacter sp.]
NAPIIKSQHEPNTFYHCAQLVLRTRDMGLTWEEVSPDLTRNMDDKQGKGGGPYTVEAVGAENYGTIAYMIESPHEKGVLWTGSDDGLVHITKDNGETWQNVTPKGLQECLVNAIEISSHDPATAYIATTRYKFNDYTPAIYKTRDYGKSWTNISSGIPYGAFTRVVREDENRKNLLYAGSEKGIYISWNGGQAWEPFQLNLPKTPITDLKVHKGNLVVATSGRSFWILDDLSALAQYQPSQSGLKIFKPAEALNGSWGSPLNSNSEKFKGTHPFNGVNPANGMVIYYELPKIPDSTHISMEIANAKGKVVRSFNSQRDKDAMKFNGGGPPQAPLLSKKEGLNRFVWDMKNPLLPGIPDVYIEARFRGHAAPPGRYAIKLKIGNEVATTVGTIIEIPTYETKPGQYEEYDAFMTELEQKLIQMHNKVNALFKAQKQLKSVIADLKDDALKAEGEKLLEQMDAWDKDMVQRKSKAYDDVENFPNKFTAEYLFLIDATNSSIPRVNKSSKDRKAELDVQWDVLNKEAERLINTAIPAYNKNLWEAGIGAIRL